HAAVMVEDDRGIGESAGEVGRVLQLWMILPGFEAEAELGELREAFAEFAIEHLVWRNDARGKPADRIAAIPRHAVAYSSEAPGADRKLSLQHIANLRAGGEVGVADDSLGNAAGAVIAGRTHRRDAVDEL